MHNLLYTLDKPEKVYQLWNLEITVIKMYGKILSDFLKLLKDNVKLRVNHE